MTTLGSTSLACVTLVAGFALGMQAARAAQAPEDKPIAVQSVNHISVFVRSVEKTMQWHHELLGTEIPKITDLAKPPIYPKELGWNANSRPRYTHVQLQNARIELQEPAGGEPNRWNDFIAKHGQGIEHLGFAVANVQESLKRFQKAGGKLIMGGCEGCTAHVDMRDTLGYVVELQPIPKQ
jgi:predicted enzyme related to lactoylglutathione lyase